MKLSTLHYLIVAYALVIAMFVASAPQAMAYYQPTEPLEKRLEICTAVFYEYLGEDEPISVEECLNNTFKVTREDSKGTWFYFLGQAGPWGRLMECELVNAKPLNHNQPTIENCREILSSNF